jgi:hypothetical protein
MNAVVWFWGFLGFLHIVQKPQKPKKRQVKLIVAFRDFAKAPKMDTISASPQGNQTRGILPSNSFSHTPIKPSLQLMKHH